MNSFRSQTALYVRPADASNPLSYEELLEKLNASDRAKVEKHQAACAEEHDLGHGALWRRMLCKLVELSRHSIKFNGQQSIQFYVADGRYRMQVFAIEDHSKGELGIYCGDVLDRGIEAGMLAEEPHDEAQNRYRVANSD